MDKLGHIAKSSNASDRMNDLRLLPTPTNADEYHHFNMKRARIQNEFLVAQRENVRLQRQLLLRTIESVIINGFEEDVLAPDLYLTSLEIVENISDTTCGETRANVATYIRDSLLHLIVGLETLLLRIRKDVSRVSTIESLNIDKGILHIAVVE